MAARSGANWQKLGAAHPDRIASLALVCSPAQRLPSRRSSAMLNPDEVAQWPHAATQAET
jgi:hypothetical protein